MKVEGRKFRVQNSGFAIQGLGFVVGGVKNLGVRGNRLEALDGHLLDLFRLFLHPIIAPYFLGDLRRWINSVQPSTRFRIRSTNPVHASAKEG